MLGLGVWSRQEWVSMTTLKQMKSGNLGFLLKNMKNMNDKIITSYSKSEISCYEFKNMDLGTHS